MGTFKPFSVKIVTWDEATCDDIHEVLCNSDMHGNVFIWQMNSTDGSPDTWEVSGAVMSEGQASDLNECVKRNLFTIDKFERRYNVSK